MWLVKAKDVPGSPLSPRIPELVRTGGAHGGDDGRFQDGHATLNEAIRSLPDDLIPQSQLGAEDPR